MCEWGNTKSLEVIIPTHLSSTGKEKKKIVGVDECIFDLVKALNDTGLTTMACCCGHGKQASSIILEGDKEIRILSFKDARKVDALFEPINDRPNEWKYKIKRFLLNLILNN